MNTWTAIYQVGVGRPSSLSLITTENSPDPPMFLKAPWLYFVI